MSTPNSILAFAKRHAGSNIIVSGLGTSATLLGNPERFLTIGVNDLGRLYTPDYLVVLNPLESFEESRRKWISDSRSTAVFSQYDLALSQHNLVKLRLGSRGGNRIDGDKLPYSNNSPYVAIQVARLLGARRIGLLGVDFTDNHFYAATGRHNLTPYLAQIERDYALLHRDLQAEGIELFNLSPDSRLQALPKAEFEAEAWLPDAHVAIRPSEPSGKDKPSVIIQDHRGGVIGELFEGLASSLQKLGYQVGRGRPHPRVPGQLAFVWNGRLYPPNGRIFYCEHGWLPRSAYQISLQGINADSHLAPFSWDGKKLSARERNKVKRHLKNIRESESRQFNDKMADYIAKLPERFILVPLQIETDTNIEKHVPRHLRRMQLFIDRISKANPPWPLLVKQHPADVRRGAGQTRLRTQRKGDRLVPARLGSVHQLLASGKCAAIITLNSNVAHDGLVWDVPVIVLGRNIWPDREDENSPFRYGLPQDWNEFETWAKAGKTREIQQAYCRYIIEHQWTLEDVADTAKLTRLLDSAAAIPGTNPGHNNAAKPASVTRAPKRHGDAKPVQAPPELPLINVVATDAGWLFEDLKRHFAKHPYPHARVVASAKARPQADAWIYIRATEAAASPNPARTLVYVHDVVDDGRYAPGGPCRHLERCGGLSLSHPDQREILQRNGIVLDDKQLLLQPPGAADAFRLERQLPETFTVGWIGRPVYRDKQDIKRVDWFIEAVLAQQTRPQVVLLGERLESQYALLKRAGVPVHYHHKNTVTYQRYPSIYQQLDCSVITSKMASGPLCLFESLASGVPVISTDCGWASELISPGENGHVIASVAQLSSSLEQLSREREQWLQKADYIRATVADYRLEDWLSKNLDLVRKLANG